MKAEKKNTKTMMLSILVVVLLLLAGCNKNPQYDSPDNVITAQTVSQTFGVQIGTKVSKMQAKGWNITTWTPEYSPTPYNLVVTGTGLSTGTNYIKPVTVQELKNGITFDMIPGSYHVTYETIHTQTPGYSMDGWTIDQLMSQGNKTVGQYLDISIDNNVIITGSPLSLTATLQDALIVIDIYGVTSAERQADSVQRMFAALFLNTKFATDGIFYGYVNAQPLYVWLYCPTYTGGGTMVNLTSAVNGSAYHLVKPFNAAVELNIPGLISENVIVP